MKLGLTVKTSALAIAAAITLPNVAQAQLDEIVVTAQSRAKGLQDTPISISAVGGEKLADTVIQKSEDLQFFVPNFTMTETGIATNIFIRGIGSGINQAFEQSVATYIDGVHYPRAQQTRSPFLDIERVEVLRGPQAILFGKNAVAGALNITTAKPTDELTGYLSGAYEFLDDEWVIEGAISGPLTDRVRARVAGRYRDHEGYLENLTLDRSEPAREDWMIRGQMEFDLQDNLLFSVKAELGEFDVTGRHIEVIGELPSVAPGPFNGLTYGQILAGGFGADPSVLNTTQDGQRSSNGDFSNNETQAYVGNLVWDVNDFEIRSTTAYQNFKYDELCDCDFTGAVVFDALLQEEYSQWSSELRVTSPVWDQFDFVGGLYWQTSDHDYGDQIAVPSTSILIPAINALTMSTAGAAVSATQAARLATTDSDLYSAFLQVNFRPMDRVELQLGGRISHEEKDGTRTLAITDLNFQPLPAAQIAAPLIYANLFGITSTNLNDLALAPVPQLSVPANALLGALGTLPVADSLEETRFSPDIKLVWDATDDLLLYASWARGYKSSGFDFRANNRNFYSTLQDSFRFGDEQATNYELGGKISLGSSAEINFAGFFTKFDDLQISIFDGVLGFNVGNAASAEILGFEVDGRWAVSDFLTLSGAAAVTDFEFTDFQNGQCYFGRTPDSANFPGLCDYTGETNQLVSDFQATVTSDVHFPIFNNYEVSWVTDLFYTTEYHASATYDPALLQDDYAMVNMRLGLAPDAGGWSLALLAKNLTDQEFLQFGGDLPLAGSTFGAKSNYAFFSQGRTLWLQARVEF